MVVKNFQNGINIFENSYRSVPYFEGNNALRLNAEKLFLRILSHEDFVIKRNVYRMCAQKMKYYFSSLMDGAQILNHSSLRSQTHFLGIPLTVDILIEIICFGCTHQEADVCIEFCLHFYLFLLIEPVYLRNTYRLKKTLMQWYR